LVLATVLPARLPAPIPEHYTKSTSLPDLHLAGLIMTHAAHPNV
jgi:hypothetical protein